ncbi:hypothetical protein [Sphingomonas mucosissima]|uniref:Mitochondrial inner membrane protein n=1 Tax=Sphingomonas mucosissima TaxID=370959 RepID=A0A245ZPP7_9SPHN|nr:hypothetical protein [Sphingomonas mucosissima]OWK31726.1 hypothetical protein SPMU_00440 [Sphingomonas mucosissima]
MDEAVPLDPAPRRSRVGLITVFVVLALVVGFGLMWFSVQEGPGWWQQPAGPVASPTATPREAPPAQSGAAMLGPVDAVTLATRESALAAQLAALEGRAAGMKLDVSASADRAARAEAILVAFAARRAIERGRPLGYLEEQLHQRFGSTQPQAVDTIVQVGQDPVTLEGLREALDANAPLLLNPGTRHWFDGLLDELRHLIVLRDANLPSAIPSERLMRARRLIDVGRVDAALEEVARLPGGAQAVNWTNAARRYVAATRALDALETAAIVGTISGAAQTALSTHLETPDVASAPEQENPAR